MLLAIIFSLIVGLTTGYFIDTSVLKILINPLLFTILFPIIVTIDFEKALNSKSLRLQIITQLYNFTIIPLLSIIFINIFFKNNNLISFGFLFYMLLPAAGIAIFWTKKLEGNALNSLKTVLFGLILGAFLAPLLISILLKNNLDIDSIKIIKTNLTILLLPLILGYFINKYLIKKYNPQEFMKLKPKIMMISQISVVCMVFIGISLKSNLILSNLMMVLKIFIPVLLFFLIQYPLSHFIGGLFLNNKDRISFVYSTTLKNISLALGISITLLKENAPPVIVLIALTYIIQQLSAPLYYKFMANNKKL